MKRLFIFATGFWVLMMLIAGPRSAAAGTPAEEIKQGSKEAVTEIKDGAVQTGKVFVETGKEIKDGAIKTGTAIKESAIEAGKDIKKAFQETKAAVTKEFTGNGKDPAADTKTEEKK